MKTGPDQSYSHFSKLKNSTTTFRLKNSATTDTQDLWSKLKFYFWIKVVTFY